MQAFKKILIISISCFTFLGIAAFSYLVYKGANLGTAINLDAESNLKSGNTIGTYLASAFSIASALLVVYALIQQSIERKKTVVKDHFLKC